MKEVKQFTADLEDTAVILLSGGWDVGPGEDGDLVLRLRKAAWKIVHAL